MSRLRPLWAALATAGLVVSPRGLAAQGRTDSVDVVVAATTDVHGHLRGWNYYDNAPDPARGLTRAATIVDSLRDVAKGRLVLVDAGDLLEGNPLAYVAARIDTAGPHPVIAAMNMMHYDAAAVGNHEFNYGLPFLRRAIGQAKFPFLAANAFTPRGTHAFTSYTIVRRQGVPVGIVGATTPGSNLWDHDNLRGKLVVRDIVPNVRTAVAAARRAGAAAVIVVLHSGLDEPSSYDTAGTGLPSENVAARVAHEVRGIDLIVYGHSHEQMADTTIAGVLLMQPRNYATSVGVAHLVVRRTRTGWHVARKESTLVQCAGHAESPAVLVATDRAHVAAVRYVTTPIGTTSAVWRADSARVADTPLIDFVLDVERRAAHSDLASTAAFSLTANIDSGPVTIAEIAQLYPYDNTLEAVRITGRQLREYLEYSARYFGTAGTDEPPVNPAIPGFNFDIVSGADYTIDLSRHAGSRITRLEVHGRPVADTDTFTLAVNNYRLAGGGGYSMLRGAPVVYTSQQEIRDLLIDAVRRTQRLDPAAVQQHNWRIVPESAVASAYAAMHAGRSPGGRIRVPVRPPTEPPRIPTPIRPPDSARATGPRLRIIATNDFHGALEPVVDSARARHGGAIAMAVTIEHAEHECTSPCASVLVSAGDLFQGSAASNVEFGRPVVDLFDRLGYAASAVGNHEFDWGIDTLRARMREARFGMFAANVRAADGSRPDWVRADTIVERGGFQVGIIGIIGPETFTSIMARNVASLRFVDPVPIVDSLARDLRAHGANVVIVLAHSGAFCDENGGATACHGEIIDLARRLTEPIDAIVSGHTHSLVDTQVNGIPIVQARSSGRAVAVIDLVPHDDGRAAVLDARVLETPTDPGPVDPAVDSVVDDAEASVKPLVSRRIARLAQPLPRTGDQYALGNLIADAQRRAGDADVAVMNNGGIRAALPAGDVTYGDLFDVQPFGNALRKLTVPASALRAYLEWLVDVSPPRSHVSGVTITYDTTRAPGSRLVDVRFSDGRTLRDGASYTIVLNDFMATGRGARGLVAAATRDETLPMSDLDALIAYLRARPQPVRALLERRLVSR